MEQCRFLKLVHCIDNHHLICITGHGAYTDELSTLKNIKQQTDMPMKTEDANMIGLADNMM